MILMLDRSLLMHSPFKHVNKLKLTHDVSFAACVSPDFLCYDNSTCVKEYKVCDGRQDCPGNDDELQCGMLLSLLKLF